MGDVINLAEHKPHLRGPAMCTACSHEWQAVAEVGTTTLECEACSRWFGVWVAPVNPEDRWECNCGNQLFWLTPEGAQCRGCGIISTDWIDG